MRSLGDKSKMKLMRLFLVFGFIVLFPCSGDLALAQVPPHPPGTVCYTPNFWCWAQPPGPPGTMCICPSPYGPVYGVRG